MVHCLSSVRIIWSFDQHRLRLFCSTKKRLIQVIIGLATLFCFAVVAIALTFLFTSKYTLSFGITQTLDLAFKHTIKTYLTIQYLNN